ncbi:hypothetical protein BJX99DRAFT_220002 [Aspergillus californicus]
MKSFQLLSATLSILSLSTASPCKPRSSVVITSDQIIAIAPNSTSCANAPALADGECATAAIAAPAISTSFNKYAITSKAEQAAIIALMAFESAEFWYSRNHFPGVAGQGTRNMQSPAFNKLYAESLPALKGRLDAVQDDPAALLDLLLEDKAVDFGSGAWFLKTQCEDSVREALQNDGEEGWKGYITECVGTEANEGRRAYWVAAVEALGA